MHSIKLEDMVITVDKENNVVVCKLFNCEGIAITRIEKYINEYCYNKERYKINDTFTGVARCCPDDTWDPYVGISLAIERAKKKRNAAINNALMKYINDKYNSLERLVNYGIHEWDD